MCMCRAMLFLTKIRNEKKDVIIEWIFLFQTNIVSLSACFIIYLQLVDVTYIKGKTKHKQSVRLLSCQVVRLSGYHCYILVILSCLVNLLFLLTIFRKGTIRIYLSSSCLCV